MSEVLFLFNVERENPVCSLFGVNTTSSLKALRAAVADQVSELMPETFLFAWDKKQQIPKSAEDSIIINTITSQDNVGNLTVKFSDISSCSSDKEATSTTESGNSVSNDAATFSDDSSKLECFERKRDTISVNQALKSPTSWSIRGVKVFTNEEIENAVGREKQRRTFWNQKAKQLSKTLLPKAKIYEKIHAAWRLQKSENLLQQGRADDELANNTSNSSPPSSSSSKAKVKKGTLQKNIARVEMYKAEYTKLSNEVKELLVGKPTDNVEKLRNLRARLDLSKSNLKKAQDAMRKTLKKLE